MKLIVGLGNPGPRYAPTRHNVGFRVVERLAEQLGWPWQEQRSQALLASGMIGDEKVILVKPLTYMNLSGTAVGELARWYRLTPQDILVVCDDLDLPVGRLRLRPRGSSAGHHGLASIAQHLGSEQFPRLRVGIGRPTDRHMAITDYVLSAARGDERRRLEEAEQEAADALKLLLTRGLEAAMNVVNAEPTAQQRAREQQQRQQARRPPIEVGMVARLFPGQARSVHSEIAFARANGFRWLQFRGSEHGLDERLLGTTPASLGAALAEVGLGSALEIALRLRGDGSSAAGQTITAVLRANLPAIQALRCSYVHFHLTAALNTAESRRALEERLLPELREATALAASGQPAFRLGIENDSPAGGIFATPERCAWLLTELPALGLVWDLNHTPPEQLPAYLELSTRILLLHVSDTPLPQLNYHLPLGMGSLDIEGYCEELLMRGFSGPAILEIGGTPLSGGFGRDSDEALIASAQRLRMAIGRAYARVRTRQRVPSAIAATAEENGPSAQP
jgi:PTH1 family peptidyl-tRNA hydrolase